MGIIRINRSPSRRQLATFGATWLLFFTLVAVVLWRRGASPHAVLAAASAAAIVPLVGCVAPRFIRIVYLAMAYAAFPIGFVLSHLLLAVVYYLVVTPIGLLMRTLGHDPINRSFDSGAQSYWVPRTRSEDDVDGYFRQA